MNDRPGIGAAALAIILAIPATGTAGAQDTARMARLDSLAQALQRAEARIQVLETQVASDASSGVKARSGARIELSGRLLVNSFSDSRRVNNVDNPQFVRPDTVAGIPVRGLGMSPRQSMLRLAAIVPDVAGGVFVGDIDVDFNGGQQPSSGGRTFPLLRLRTMRATLRLPHVELMAGQDSPLIAGLNPVSLGAIGTPAFATAGNLWLWLPQMRVSLETMSRVRFGIQGAVLAPTSGEPAAAFETDFDGAERANRPMIQGRLRARLGPDEFAGEIGCGAHLGWLAVSAGAAPDGGSLVENRALACDARLPMTRWAELRGEAYTGQALRGLGGGGIGQALGPGNVAVRDRGAWAQLNVKPSFRWSTGVGCGIDDPDDRDLAAGARLQNTACSAHVHVRSPGPVVLALEARRIVTRYAIGAFANDHFNFGIGFEY
jgi:hypothetical protein